MKQTKPQKSHTEQRVRSDQPQPQNDILSSEAALRVISSKISREMRFAFLAAVVAGLIAHLYFFTNNIPNSDQITNSPYHTQHSWDLALGRWAINYADKLGTCFTLPWVTGLLCLFFIGLVSALLINLFQVKSRLNIILISAMIAVAPTISISFSYSFMADIYMISYFFAVLAVFCADRYKTIGIISGAILIACSMGLYQAYIGVTITLCIILLIVKLLMQEQDLRTLFFYGLRLLLTGILGVVLYFMILWAHLSYHHISLADYRGVNNMGQVKISELPSLFIQCYQYFFDVFFTNYIFNNTPFQITTYSVLFAIILGLIIYQAVRKKINRGAAAVLGILVLLLPFAVGVMKLLAPETDVSPLMAPQIPLFLILPLLLLELPNVAGKQSFKQVMSWLAAVSCFILVFGYWELDNIMYLSLQLQYERTYSISLRILDRIEQLPGYNHNLKLAVIGDLPSENYPQTGSSEDAVLKGYPQTDKEILPYRTISSSWNKFMRDYLGADIADIGWETNDAEIKKIKDSSDFKNMKEFPSADSTKIMNGVIVVKLSS